VGEALGLPVWGRVKPAPIRQYPSLAPPGSPTGSQHEGPTAKLLTLFRPVTGEVQAESVTQATNAVVHPWLRGLRAIWTQRRPSLRGPTPGRRWSDWDWPEAACLLDRHSPPVRVLLTWDNLEEHMSTGLVRWLGQQGIAPLYTSLGGPWLNLTESVQRILARCALAGQHPQHAGEIMGWLGARLECRVDAIYLGWPRGTKVAAVPRMPTYPGRLRRL
jgi:hypothetical protein